ncbi:MAG: hypothetical protein IK085_08960 [Clostridia bacterium]|nr:hypothetical protein [Clostridia bacterium]MBR6005307.1 hypothetical protein [Clostridia bacterium]
MKHKRFNKNRFATCIVCLAVSFMTLITQETVAYYATSEIASNVITSGDIALKIVEKSGESEFPAEGVEVKTGDIVSKKVSVKNTGGHPFWLRIKLTNGISNEALSADVFEIEFNNEDWIAGSDGYYYYKEIVQPGTETAKLFSQVKIAGSLDNAYNGEKAFLTVTAYGVQSEFNGTGSPLDVAGWPDA